MNGARYPGLIRAHLWRSRQVGWSRTVVFAAGSGVLVAGFAVLARFASAVMTSATRSGLGQAAAALFPSLTTAQGMAMAMAWIQGPALVLLLGSMPIASYATALTTQEVGEGRAEYLLAMGYPPRAIATSLSVSAAIRGALLYASTAAAWFVAVLAVTAQMGAVGLVPWRYCAMFLPLGLAFSVFSALIVTLVGIRWPGVNAMKVGTSSATGLISAVPGLVVLLVLTFGGGDNPRQTVLTITAILVPVAVAFSAWLFTGMRRRSLLA